MKTAEQKRLLRYAEAMGRFPRANGHLVWGTWNPLTDANDALELAEAMDVLYERDGNHEFWARTPGACSLQKASLPAAICAAVDAVLGEPKP